MLTILFSIYIKQKLETFFFLNYLNRGVLDKEVQGESAHKLQNRGNTNDFHLSFMRNEV